MPCLRNEFSSLVIVDWKTSLREELFKGWRENLEESIGVAATKISEG